jgi:Holliday junction resolvasome RuvABC endonuclease subunit
VVGVGETVRPVVGLDLSLTSTGIATWPDHAAQIRTSPKDWPDEIRRIGHIWQEIEWRTVGMNTQRPLVVIEGLSYGSQSAGQSHTRAGLHYMVRLELDRLGCQVIVVPPATLKKFVTGSGNASKELMVSTVSKRSNRLISSDDVADALGLLAFGCEWEGVQGPLGVLPAAQRAVVDKLKGAQ